MTATKIFTKLLSFWVYLVLFKAAASLHYAIFPVLGEQLFPVWIVGVLVSAGAFFQMCLDVPAGYILDRFGYIRTLKVSSVCFLAAAIVLLFGVQSWTIVATLLLALIGWLFFGPGADAYVMVKAEKRAAGEYMATRDVMESAGVVLGMAALPFVIHIHHRLLALVMLIPFCISLVALYRASADPRSLHPSSAEGARSLSVRRSFMRSLVQSLQEMNIVGYVLMMQRFSAAVFYGIIWFVVPLMITSQSESGPLSFGLVVFDSAVLFTGFFLGKLADRWDKRWLVFWGMLLFSLCGLLLGFNFGFLFIILGFLATTGDEMASVSLWAWLDRVNKKTNHDGLVTGAMTLAEDLGWTVGPLLAGILFETLGATSTIVAGAACVTGVWVISSVLMFRSNADTQDVIMGSKQQRRKKSLTT